MDSSSTPVIYPSTPVVVVSKILSVSTPVVAVSKVPFEGVWYEDVPNWDDDVSNETPNHKYLDSSEEFELPKFVQLLEEVFPETEIMTEIFGKGKPVMTGELK